MFRLVQRGIGHVRSPMTVLKDAPEIVPVVAAGGLVCGMAVYIAGKKLLFDDSVILKRKPEEPWKIHADRLQK
ncbi:hypothetical protein HMI54_001374 [Coelomomyces lativittatus]|nr:hypothetical protein HMI54_001374 [Coelomomyces lativittatus]